MKILLKSKIHRATVTECNVDYVGSISIDSDLMERANLVSGEQVHVANLENGNRLITYAILGKKGEICLNGAAAHLFSKGDKIIIMAFEICDEIRSKTILVDDKNRFLREV